MVPGKEPELKQLCPSILFLLLAFMVSPEPAAAQTDLPPGEPTFFAGNPATRQLAFRYRLGLKVLGWSANRTGVYGIFRQSSFWLLDNENRGYTVESNYEPEVLALIDGRRVARSTRWWPRNLDLGFSYSHHSNGIDGDLSRSWNHANLGFYLGRPDRDTVSGSMIAWVPFNQEAGNRDITRFAGHGRLAVSLNPARPVGKLGRAELYMASNLSLDGHVFTNLEMSLSFAPPWLGRPPFPGPEPRFAFFIQWFHGPGESLIEYAKFQDSVRFGLRLW